MILFFNAAATDPASALVRSATNNQAGPRPTFVLGDNPTVDIYVTDGAGGFDPQSGNPTVTPWLGIGTPGAGPSGGTFWLGVASATSGGLVAGKRFQIATYAPGDDFTNLGAAENASGILFTATGDTPAVWTNGSTLVEITADIAYDATAAAVEAAIEATETVIGVTVTKSGSAPVFVIEWNAYGVAPLLIGGASSLTPASAVVTSRLTEGGADAAEKQIVRLTRQPYALQTVWSPINNGWSARLDCNTRGLLDLLGDAASIGSTLELQLVDADSNIRTVGQVSVLIRNEAIDEESTIPAPFPAYLTAVQTGQLFVQNRFTVTALTGGADALDGVETGTTANPIVPTNAMVCIDIADTLGFYELVAGTDAESLPSVVRPDDYNEPANERVWKLRSIGSLPLNHATTHQAGGSDVVNVAGLSGLLADAQTPTSHAATHASGGGDAITIAQSQVTSLTTALAAKLAIAGGTMTGQLNFSGTTHAGIKLISLTTTQRNALTPANGMMIYNSTTAKVERYEGGAWVSNDAPTAHATTHKHGGSDEVATATPAANAIPKADATGKLAAGWIPASGGGGSQLLYAENPSSPTSPVASGANAVAIGNNARAIGSHSLAIGNDSQSSGTNSLAAGFSSRATGAESIALNGGQAVGIGCTAIGQNTLAYGGYCVAAGYGAATNMSGPNALGAVALGVSTRANRQASLATGQDSSTHLYGKHAHASGCFATNSGDAQAGIVVLKAATTDATPASLLIGWGDYATIPENTTWMFKVSLVARRTDAAGESWSCEFYGIISRDAGDTTALVGLVTKSPAPGVVTLWDADVTANALVGPFSNANNSLEISVTGEAAKTIRWVARVETTEVSN